MHHPIPRSGIESHAWPAVPPQEVANLLSLQWQLDRSDRLAPETLRSLQFEQLRAVADHAYRTVPYQHQRLHAAGYRGPGDLERLWHALPVTTRRAVREAGPAMFSTAPPAGHGVLLGGVTSGSTGTPLDFRKTGLCQILWNAFGLREIRWHGIDCRRRLVRIWRVDDGSAAWPQGAQWPDWGTLIARAYPTGSSAALDITTPVAQQVEWLQRQAPAYLATFPSNLAALARHCLDRGIALPGLQAARSFGEILSPRVRALCRAAWGAPVIDCYSAEEIGYMALQCPEHEHYHVMAEGVLLEVLDEAGRPCAPGEVGRVVVSSLHNFAMPFLRYEIGDYAEPGAPCSCGRSLPVLTRILGRSRQRILLPTGERQFADNPDETFAAIDAVLQHQIVQHRPDRLTLYLVLRRPLAAAEAERLRRAVAAEFRHPFPVDIVPVEAIPRLARGKFEDIRSDLVEPR